MDKDVLAMALAGFMHDIGKFVQRAEIKIPLDFRDNNQDIYLPFYNNHFSYEHSLYTAFFVNNLEKDIPELQSLKVENVSLINLAAGHHKPKNDYERIIQKADHISSAIDRNETEDEIKSSWLDTRLMSVFEEIDINKNEVNLNSYSDKDYKYRYSLNKISPITIFPINTEVNNNLGDYKSLYIEFESALKILAHKDNLEIWFEHLDSLCMAYTHAIPSATRRNIIPDASLYDHLKTTSALSQALYIYHKKNNSLNIDSISNDTEQKFIYLKSKFHGIQNFIFAEGGQTNKNSAKLLRGRSFYISLLMELAGDMLCKNIGITNSAIIMSAAGGITAILPNTQETKQKIKETEETINDWLIKNFYGQVSIGFGYIEVSTNDLIKKRSVNSNEKDGLSIISQKIAKKLDIKKFQKIPMKYFGKIQDDNYFKDNKTICSYCGIKPATKKEEKSDVKCDICNDLIKIGENITKNNKIIIINPNDRNKNILSVSIYDKYGICFNDEQDFYLNTTPKSLYKYWDLSIDNIATSKTTTKQFGAYVPKNNNFEVRTFEEIIENNKHGINALGVLKCDIDNLGTIFFKGTSKRHGTSLAKDATFSRQVNSFFTIYLQYLFKKEEKYNDIYTVFAGGDDLFLIGEWNTIIDLSFDIRSAFKNFSCNNSQVTFSTGISILKPSEPIKMFYSISENALEKSKRAENKNSLTLFDTTISWDNISEFNRIDDYMSDKINAGIFNTAFLYKMLYFTEMAQKEKQIKNNNIKKIELKDMQCFKWKPLLKYFISRNSEIKDSLQKDNVLNTILEYLKESNINIFKMVLYKQIYKNRN